MIWLDLYIWSLDAYSFYSDWARERLKLWAIKYKKDILAKRPSSRSMSSFKNCSSSNSSLVIVFILELICFYNFPPNLELLCIGSIAEKAFRSVMFSNKSSAVVLDELIYFFNLLHISVLRVFSFMRTLALVSSLFHHYQWQLSQRIHGKSHLESLATTLSYLYP